MAGRDRAQAGVVVARGGDGLEDGPAAGAVGRPLELVAGHRRARRRPGRHRPREVDGGPALGRRAEARRRQRRERLGGRRGHARPGARAPGAGGAHPVVAGRVRAQPGVAVARGGDGLEDGPAAGAVGRPLELVAGHRRARRRRGRRRPRQVDGGPARGRRAEGRRRQRRAQVHLDDRGEGVEVEAASARCLGAEDGRAAASPDDDLRSAEELADGGLRSNGVRAGRHVVGPDGVSGLVRAVAVAVVVPAPVEEVGVIVGDLRAVQPVDGHAQRGAREGRGGVVPRIHGGRGDQGAEPGLERLQGLVVVRRPLHVGVVVRDLGGGAVSRRGGDEQQAEALPGGEDGIVARVGGDERPVHRDGLPGRGGLRSGRRGGKEQEEQGGGQREEHRCPRTPPPARSSGAQHVTASHAASVLARGRGQPVPVSLHRGNCGAGAQASSGCSPGRRIGARRRSSGCRTRYAPTPGPIADTVAGNARHSLSLSPESLMQQTEG